MCPQEKFNCFCEKVYDMKELVVDGTSGEAEDLVEFLEFALLAATVGAGGGAMVTPVGW